MKHSLIAIQARLNTTAAADLNSKAGILALLKSLGMTGGAGQYLTFKPITRALTTALKGTWDFKKGPYGDYRVVNKANPDSYFLFEPAGKGSATTFVTIKSDSFPIKPGAKADIYTVTRNHPAYNYVLDYLDMADYPKGAARKVAVKKAVDEYMRDRGIHAMELSDKILQNKRNNKTFGVDY